MTESNEACLYVALACPPESHDRLLQELVAPIVRELRGRPELDSLFFVRYADPTWQLRFRVLGRPEWIDGPVRARVQRAIEPFVEERVIEGVEFGSYVREWERYGGPEGMAIAEQIFLQDSLACLEVLEAERLGRLGATRREFSLAFTERFLDLFRFGTSERLDFYREGHAWAFRDGVFQERDRERLERQYRGVREGLVSSRRVLRGDAARIAEGLLLGLGPHVDRLLEAHAAGRIRQTLLHLAWSYAHLHCNRLGIELVAEAILRYLMFRLYEEGSAVSGPES